MSSLPQGEQQHQVSDGRGAIAEQIVDWKPEVSPAAWRSWMSWLLKKRSRGC